jgi:hypothetical protein
MHAAFTILRAEAGRKVSSEAFTTPGRPLPHSPPFRALTTTACDVLLDLLKRQDAHGIFFLKFCRPAQRFEGSSDLSVFRSVCVLMPAPFPTRDRAHVHSAQDSYVHLRESN